MFDSGLVGSTIRGFFLGSETSNPCLLYPHPHSKGNSPSPSLSWSVLYSGLTLLRTSSGQECHLIQQQSIRRPGSSLWGTLAQRNELGQPDSLYWELEPRNMKRPCNLQNLKLWQGWLCAVRCYEQAETRGQ